jgi:hypothetical protein
MRVDEADQLVKRIDPGGGSAPTTFYRLLEFGTTAIIDETEAGSRSGPDVEDASLGEAIFGSHGSINTTKVVIMASVRQAFRGGSQSCRAVRPPSIR